MAGTQDKGQPQPGRRPAIGHGDNLIRNLAYWARVRGDAKSVVVDAQALTWRELNDQANRFANGLIAQGFRPGDRVGMLMHNQLAFPVAMLGTLRAGGAIVLLNVRYTPDEMHHPVTDSALSVVVADEVLLPLLAGIGDYAGRVEVVTTTPVTGYANFAEVLADDPADPGVAVSGEDIAMICYTSGTTGLPKGAAMSHQAIYAAGAAKTYVVRQSFDDRMLLPMPMAYTAGSVFFLRDGIQSGQTTYFLSKPTAETMLDMIERERITAIEGVAVLYEMMMSHPRFAEADLSSLRRAVTGGQFVSMELLRRWQERGVHLSQGYGQTESAGSYITILTTDEALSRIGSAGLPMPNLDVRVMREDGTEAQPGESGEIWVRGASIMTCYINRPDETAAALAGGWLHTGDIGVMDQDGYLKIVDRTKDMLISGGLNVYPAEIEKALGGFAGLEDIAVIGVKDARWGEVPILVTSNLAGVDLDALRALCRERLADYKRPRFLIAHPEPLPRTFSGKITKLALRQRYPEAPAGAIPL